ncbi:hypothetical protein CRM22_006503 [Opisthorchis felineus]|uniref:Uncharacterized protein n=1 Tax=Opisthorchis felineus TaxID=147828 RepID=A0A4S2LMD8_OPIFE|nr:hypothetical protein CRM22_006503 [Opisthorchis felineus]
MTDDMISSKTLVVWSPTGQQYVLEFVTPTTETFRVQESVTHELTCATVHHKNSNNENCQTRRLNGITEELYTYSNYLIWNTGSEFSAQFPKLIHETETPIVTACWASFFLPSSHSDSFIPKVTANTSGRLQQGIAIFEAERLTFISCEGEQFTARLPCRVGSAWPLETCILLERQRPTQQTSGAPGAVKHNNQQKSPRTLFTMFSLSHPLDEAAPVLLKIPLPTGGFGVSFISDVDLKFVAVFPCSNLILTRHLATGVHSLWKLQAAVPEDYAHLYEVGEDGRACVAPYALRQEVGGFTKSAANLPEHTNETHLIITPSLGMPKSTRLTPPPMSRSVAPQTPNSQQKVCLSPFAASLSRLTGGGYPAPERSSKWESPLTQVIPYQKTSPFTPTNLVAQVSRLSSVRAARPSSSTSTVTGLCAPSSTRPFIPGPQVKLNLLQPNYQTARSPFGLSSNSPLLMRFGSTAVNRNGGGPHDTHHNISAAPTMVDLYGVEDLLGEPLLPKVCLRLIWTEPTTTQCSKTARIRIRWNSKVDEMEEDADTDQPLKLTHITPAISLPPANRRLLDLSRQSTPTTVSPKSTCALQPEVFLPLLPQVPQCSSALPINSAQTNATQLPKPVAFWAVDLSSTAWICFLTSRSHQKGRVTSLACFPVPADLATQEPSEEPSLAHWSLSYLPATDAVYVPVSRLTACLELGTGVVLYTGITKICVLGVAPPPLFSTRSSVASHRTLVRNRKNRAPQSVRCPFVIRPDSTALDCLNERTVPNILNRVDSCIRDFLSDGISEDLICTDNHKRFASWFVRTVEPVTNCAITSVSNCSALDDASGNSFSFRLTDIVTPNQDNQPLRVYLPSISEDELVQRCLVSLKQSLPSDVSLHLLSRWFAVNNAPGTSSVQFDPSSTPFIGSPEWIRFAQFMLQACGFVFLSDDESAQQPVHPGDRTPVGALPPAIQSEPRLGKRQRAQTHHDSATSWEELCTLLGDFATTDPSLLTNKSTLVDRTADRAERFFLHLSSAIRTDPASRTILSNLPTILLSCHLVYEEAKLNRMMTPHLLPLASFNVILSRTLSLESYLAYYFIDWPELTTFGLLPSDWKLPSESLVWPTSMPTDYAPSLIVWMIEQLELSASVSPPQPYVHLSGVNDLAATMAGMVLAALCPPEVMYPVANRDNKDEGVRIRQLVDWWSARICHMDGPGISNVSHSLPYISGNFQSRSAAITPVEALQSSPDSLGPFRKAFVKTLFAAGTIQAFDQLSAGETSKQSSSQMSSPHNLAIIFLSQLDESSSDTQSSLDSRLRSLPDALSTLLNLWLSRSCANPPPNCAPNVYRLMRRDDLARMAELSSIGKPIPGKKVLSTGEASRKTPFKTTALSLIPSQHAPSHNSSYSKTDIWASSVLPLRQLPLPSVCARDSGTRNSLSNRHRLLWQLENNPASQVSFKDDLRLREAYRLLQASSHIRLPRLSSSDTVASTTTSDETASEQGSKLLESRLAMHVAAAGVRVWASAVGRGMLGLGSLQGSRVPTQLRVPAICLRGRAVSPTSGRRGLFDLARDSPNPLPPTNNPGAGIGVAGIGRVDAAVLDGAGVLIGDTSAGERRTPALNGVIPTGNDLTGVPFTEAVDASNHPGNALTLAVASAVAASGAGAALRTAALDLPRMVLRGGLAAVATNSASSTASLLSTANLHQTPAVLAAKHWPEFHNGVSVGLSIAPNASVDATWIMYNCRSAGTNSDNRATGAATSTTQLPTPEQAGLLFGLGLNGHLNKMTPFDIGEYLVRVHDLHNMAVLLGLCAGKRGSMDQSVLRLLAIHYRPLLPSDPLVHVQLAVPSLCQAAAVFGLGLLYQGSAHRHITNLLITELGRSLNGSTPGGASSKGLQSDGDTQHQTGGSTSNTTGPASSGGWTGAAGSGGLAGDSCELIALSAGLALGLVLLQRGDSPCGLSDLPWAEQLHAYMIGAPRVTRLPGSSGYKHSSLNFAEDICAWTDAPGRFPLRRAPGMTAHRPGLASAPPDDSLSTRSTRNDLSRVSDPGGLRNALLADVGLLWDVSPLAAESHQDLDMLPLPGEGRGRLGTRTTRSVNAVSPHAGSERVDFTGRSIDRRGPPDLGMFQASSANPQIRELDCYNADVSAPGAIMALGMAYLGSGSPTISSWLVAPSSLTQLEVIRPDLLLFRALAHGLVNWHSVVPTNEWIRSFCPPVLLDRLSRLSHSASNQSLHNSTLNDVAEVPTDPLMAELSSEDDVENRCPDLPVTNTIEGRTRAASRGPNQISTTFSVPSSVLLNRSTRSTSRRPQNLVVRGQSLTAEPTDAGRRDKLFAGLQSWENQFSMDSSGKVDGEALGLAYLNILTGRAFALGLRYAGTCHAGAAALLFDVAKSILDGSWWPHTSEVSPTDRDHHSTVSPPRPTLELAAAHCLLALSMILAGSGNVTVLRLVRQLRAIRLFHAKNADPNNRPLDTDSQLKIPWMNLTRLNAVASAAAKAAASNASSALNSSNSAASGHISIAAVFGVALGPSFGIQLIYSTIVGLLFLGGGRLTLSNTPEAAALLSIAFLPILPNFSGDNWYHLQALRHMYVLATRPRRLCAVDVDTGRIVLSDMYAMLKNPPTFVSSKGTAVFPTNRLDDFAWIESNRGSDKYWPTIFHSGTLNWEHLKCALESAGYFFVKRRNKSDENDLFKHWFGNDVPGHITDMRTLYQLKLIVTFLRRFLPMQQGTTKPPVYSSTVNFNPSKALAAAVTEQFVQRFKDVTQSLQLYYFGNHHGDSNPSLQLSTAFRVWFSLPDRHVLSPILSRVGAQPTLSQFLTVIRSSCPTLTPITSIFWLHKFLYPKTPEPRSGDLINC